MSRKRSQGKARRSKKDLVQVQSSKACTHGMPAELPQSCVNFMDSFHNELYKACGLDLKLTPLKAVMLAMDTTRIKFHDVWKDTNKRDAVKCCFINLGTDQVLKKQGRHFDFAAALAVGTLRLDDEDDSSAWSILDSKKGRSRIRDMVLSSSQEATKFFSKRTPCSCLDEMMSNVKGQAKIGQCIHCGGEKGCKSMFLCGDCRIHQYCSQECQKLAWPEHKAICEQLCKRFNKKN